MSRPHPLPVLRCAALLAMFAATLTACGPLIVGGGAAVIADEVVEDQRGGDGLF